MDEIDAQSSLRPRYIRHSAWIVVTGIVVTACVALMAMRPSQRKIPKPVARPQVPANVVGRAFEVIDQIGLLQQAHPTLRGPAYIAGLREVWNHYKDSGQPEMLKAGSCLLNALVEREDVDERIQIATKLVYAIESHRANWEKSPFQKKEDLDRYYVSYLVQIQSAETAGRHDVALFALGRQLNYAQSINDPKQIEMYQRDIARVEQEMRQRYRDSSNAPR